MPVPAAFDLSGRVAVVTGAGSPDGIGWDLVLEAFGARRLDPGLLGKEYRWLPEALLDAQPGGGWRRTSGLVLPAATALSTAGLVQDIQQHATTGRTPTLPPVGPTQASLPMSSSARSAYERRPNVTTTLAANLGVFAD